MKVKEIATAVMSAALALCCFLAAGCGSPSPELEGAEGHMRLVAALPDRYGAPLRLLAQGYTYREIAAALEISEAAVRQWVRRGRALLWKELQRDEE